MNMEDDTSKYQKYKILVLGDSGVGKSSLIHLICHDNVLNSPQWTIGCSIDIKIFKDYDSLNFLEFWDIGGSRGHKIARSFLYNDYDGIMLVFDATNSKSRSNLDEWEAEAMHKHNSESKVPMIYIGTKKDQLPKSSQLDLGQSSVVNFDSRENTRSVIYVNTQDVHCMNQNTNYSKLEKFFRDVVQPRFNKMHNRF